MSAARQLLRSADDNARAASDELVACVANLRSVAQRALQEADMATAEQRARAERAEDALRALRTPPGEPVAWQGKGVTVRVVAAAPATDVRALIGCDGVEIVVCGVLGTESAFVTIQQRAATLGESCVSLNLALGLAPHGALDQLADVLGRLIQERDAQVLAVQQARAAESLTRPIAGSAT